MRQIARALGLARARIEQVAGRWSTFKVETDRDRGEVVALLERVRRHELNRASNARSLLESETTGVDVPYEVFAVRDRANRRIVGCLRATAVSDLAGDTEADRAYRLDLVPVALRGRSRVVTHLAVLPEVRGTAASIELLRYLYRWFADHSYLVSLFVTEPGLYPMYEALGARPLAAVYGTKAGYRIPVALILPDVPHLRRVRSPFASLSYPPGPSAELDAALAWGATLPVKPDAAALGFEFFSAAAHGQAVARLTNGMTQAGENSFTHKALVVQCRVGESVVFQEDGGRQLGVVVSGALDVQRSGVSVGSISPGEPFGEVAAILAVRRTATLVSTHPETKVLLLSQRALERLERTEDQAALWSNLAKLLAERLHATTVRYADAAPSSI